ncbi:MAG: M23 family metallopeptidase [Ignavibacteriae bacterium]|nr:M23 family metallopeptidase [Ignavibacteriota bacterium]
MRSFARYIFLFALTLASHNLVSAQTNLILPTPNHNLYEHPELFYMHTARSGGDAWKGGMYGFTRNARNTKGGVVYTRFHEGVDIAPTMRDGRGVPLDSVLAVDDGVVVHVNAVAGHSNYGKYIVVRHIWDGSPFYSLYAHLNETWVDSGTVVAQGTPLGRLGYTGAGINKGRAHLHFEIAMVVNGNFDKWYDDEYGDGNNRHGYLNGMNLAGLNVARLYERLRENPDLSIRQFIEEEHPFFYSVLIPRTSRLDLLARYPWLLKHSASALDQSWKISFDDSGLPIAVEPSQREVKEPTLDSIVDSPFSYNYVTKSRVSGSNGSGRLSGGGIRYMRLVAEEPDSATLAAMEGLFADAPIPEPDMATLPSEPSTPPPPIAEEDFAVASSTITKPTAGVEVAEEEVGTRGDEITSEVESEMADGKAEVLDTLDAEPERDPSWPSPPAEADAEKSKTATEESLLRGEWHIGGYEFVWKLSKKSLSTELMPIRLRVTSEDDDLDGVGVDNLIVSCPELSRYGIGSPQVTRISEIVWSVRLQVKNKKAFAARIRELNGKVFTLDLRIQADGIEGLSQVRVEVSVKS